MHYYQHHIGDFIRDTANLTNEQLAVYLKMIWLYYDAEKPLKDDCECIAFAVRSDEKTVHLLLRHFFKLEGDGWHHTRCDKEIAAYHSKSQKAQNSANARWKNANALRTQSKRKADEPVSDANQEPITNNHINTPKPPAKPGASAAVSLPAWLTTIKAMGEQPIPENDPVFDYAEQAGIPMEYMRLCWMEFRQRYSQPNAKRYKDWRSVYRKAVRGNWFRLWRITPDGYELTTEGLQAQRVLEAKAVAA